MKRGKRTLIAVGVVVLYVLSSGPVVGFLAWRQEIQENAHPGAETVNDSSALGVFMFYIPLQFIYERFPLLGKPLGWYIGLWCPADCRENQETDLN